MGITDSLPNNLWYLLNKLALNISPKPTLCKYGLQLREAISWIEIERKYGLSA